MTPMPQKVLRLNVNLDERLHAAFKAAAALEGCRMTDLIVEFIEKYVRDHSPRLPRKGPKK